MLALSEHLLYVENTQVVGYASSRLISRGRDSFFNRLHALRGTIESLLKNKAYTLGMPRSFPLVLLVALISTVALQAQRSVATFQGHADGLRAHSGFLGQRSLSNGLFPQRGIQNGIFADRFHGHHDGRKGILLP
jgi:hypothetical protein